MLEEKVYPIQELAKVLGGAADRQNIKKKLERKGIQHEITGRGRNVMFAITHIPNPFAMFCIVELGFAPQADFQKVRNLFYYFFNDEEFSTFPDERKQTILADDGHPISRQAIAGYLEKLYAKELLHKDSSDCVYYFAHDARYRTAEKQEYLDAWHDYWTWKEEYGDLNFVCSKILSKYGGFPRKQAKPIINAFGVDIIDELIRLTNESFEKEYG